MNVTILLHFVKQNAILFIYSLQMQRTSQYEDYVSMKSLGVNFILMLLN